MDSKEVAPERTFGRINRKEEVDSSMVAGQPTTRNE